MSANTKNVAIFVFSWKYTAATKEVVKKLLCYPFSGLNIRIILIVNGAGFNRVFLLKSLNVIFIEKHIGIGLSSKIAFEHVKNWASVIVRYDNDFMLVDDAHLYLLVCQLLDDSTAGAITCKLLYPDGRLNFGCVRYNYFGGRSRFVDTVGLVRTDTFLGAFVLVKVEVLRVLNRFFDPNIILFGEELELSLAMQKIGFCVLYNPDVVGVHKTKQVIKTEEKVYNVLLIQNQIYLLKKHLGLFNAFVYVLRFMCLGVVKLDFGKIKLMFTVLLQREVSIDDWNNELEMLV